MIVRSSLRSFHIAHHQSFEEKHSVNQEWVYIFLHQRLEYGKTLDQTYTRAAIIEKQEIKTSRQKKQKTKTKQQQQTNKQDAEIGTIKLKDRGASRTESESTNCWCCGGSYPHQRERKACPAYQKEYHECGKTWNFKSVCRSSEQPKRPQHAQSTRRQRKDNTIDKD